VQQVVLNGVSLPVHDHDRRGLPARHRDIKNGIVPGLAVQDAADFLGVAAQAGVRTTTTVYPLERANDALAALRAGRFQGAAVLVP